jgi:hypothetical protein
VRDLLLVKQRTVMKTSAADLPAAAFAAPLRSVSLVDDVIVVPSELARVVMAESGVVK